jgi:Family of unknown function (DUF5990)
MDIQLQLLLQKPTPGVDFGIQKGSGSNYETAQTQRSDGGDLQFDLTIQLKSDTQKTNEPRFTGPFVQGKPLSQFFYIDVGKYTGQTAEWGGRIKVPLSGITWETIAQLSKHPTAILTTKIPGTARDGSPNLATVKNFDGWKIKKL